MSRELLKQSLDALNEIEYEDNNGEKYAWELIQSLEAELAKRDEPFGYIGGAWVRIAANGGAWDSITVSREKLDESDCALYANPPRKQEPLSKPYPLSFYHGSTGDYINGFEDGVAWAEDQHGIGGGE